MLMGWVGLNPLRGQPIKTQSELAHFFTSSYYYILLVMQILTLKMRI